MKAVFFEYDKNIYDQLDVFVFIDFNIIISNIMIIFNYCK
jgi:hypothetical protein